MCTQLHLTLCNPMNYSLPGSPVHGILQARILEWVAISFCRGSSQPRARVCVSCISCIDRQILLSLSHLGSANSVYTSLLERQAASGREEVPYIQCKRNSSKMVGAERGHQRADRLKPQSQKTKQTNRMDRSLVELVKLSHAVWGHLRRTSLGGQF